MTKKKAELQVTEDLSELFSGRKPGKKRKKSVRTITMAMDLVLAQMRAQGLRERTLEDYERHVTHFAKIVGDKELTAVTADDLFEWLSSMNVNNQTKLTRLKCVKAFLSRCLSNGWVHSTFWKNVRIRADTPVKTGATEAEVQLLLSMLDLSKFVELRDATAVLMMFQTGIRVGTLAQLRRKHIDMDSRTLRIDGGLLKNHQAIQLPFDDVLHRLLSVLLAQNKKINRHTDLVFITNAGKTVMMSPTNNNIIKRLSRYSKMYGLENINPHALRRGFAKGLLEKGASIPLISKALGHSDLAVTTRYLHISNEEVSDSLREFL